MDDFPPGHGLETHSLKKKRVYVRKFDHEEARRLHAEGRSIYSLTKQFGVSHNAIKRVVDPVFAEAMNAKVLAHLRKTRVPCVGGCGRLVWMHGDGRTGYCARCIKIVEGRAYVRDDTLRCRRCGKWKPDREFPRNRRGRGYARRGRDPWCRACATEVRRLHRERHPEMERRASERAADSRRERSKVVAEHIVLKRVENGTYQEVGNCEAPSPDIAIERTALAPGDYVAVLASRFDVVSVAPQTSLRVVRE